MIDLVRGWVVDWLNRHDPSACDHLLSSDYHLRIGSAELSGREAYIEGTWGQLRNYPGLVVTVHEVVVARNLAAIRFTEHGAARHRDGATAAWTGIAIHRAEGGAIVQSWAEEDYASRSQQLLSGAPNSIDSPAIAPWDTTESPPDDEAEECVRSWLESGPEASPGLTIDNIVDSTTAGGRLPPAVIDVLFSSGSSVAFHARSLHDDGVSQGVAGLVTVDASGQVLGHLVTDSAGVASARKRKATVSRV